MLTRPAALQRTPDGAAELGRDARQQWLDVTRLAEQPARRWTRLGVPRLLRSARLRARAVRQGKAGIEPAMPWQSLRGESLARFNITGCCTRCGHSRAGRARCPHRVQPPLCLAPPQRLRGASARGTEPMPRQYRCSCAPGVPAAQVTRSGAASGAVMELAPARPPSAPRGGSLALSTALVSVAPCSPRQGQALRAREYARP